MNKGKARLSPLPYIKHNKRRTGVLLISLAMFFLMIYSFGYLLGCTIEPFENNMYGAFSRYTLFVSRIEVGDYETTEEWNEIITPLLEEQRDRAREDLNIQDVFVVRRGYTKIYTVMGESYADVFFFDSEEEMQRFGDHMGATLVSGRMPQNPGEIVVDTMLYKNSGEDLLKSLGDGHVIVGQVECPYYVAFGSPLGIENNAMLMTIHEDKDANIVERLTDMGWDISYYDDYESSFEQFHEVTDSLSDIKIMVTSVAGVILGICVIVVLSIHIRDRHEELCLFNSIGFSSYEIYLLMLKELLICFTASIAVGVLLSFIAVAAMNHFLMEPMGLYIPLIRITDAKMAVLMLAAIFGFCQIPVFLQIRTINTVDQIE